MTRIASDEDTSRCPKTDHAGRVCLWGAGHHGVHRFGALRFGRSQRAMLAVMAAARSVTPRRHSSSNVYEVLNGLVCYRLAERDRRSDDRLAYRLTPWGRVIAGRVSG